MIASCEKKCSILLIIRETQIKTIMRYHLILLRTAIIKNSTNNICWEGWREKGTTLLHCWWECKLIQPRWKMVWRFLKNLGIKPAYDPAIPLFGIYPEEMKIERDICNPCSLQHYLQQLGHGSNLLIDVHRQMNGERNCGTYIQKNIAQP